MQYFLTLAPSHLPFAGSPCIRSHTCRQFANVYVQQDSTPATKKLRMVDGEGVAIGKDAGHNAIRENHKADESGMHNKPDKWAWMWAWAGE